MEKFIELLVRDYRLQVFSMVVFFLILFSFIYYLFKYKKQIKSIFDFFDSIDDLRKDQSQILDNQNLLMEQHAKISEEVKKIAKEAIPNGSNTLRKTNDTIFRIGEVVEKINNKLDSRIEIDKAPLFECSNGGLFTNANSSLCDLFGATKDRLMGLGWSNFIHKNDAHQILEKWQRSVSGKQLVFIDTFRLINFANKEINEVTIKAIFKYNEGGELVSMFGTMWKNVATANIKREEDIECLLEMAECFKKTSVWRTALKEINDGKQKGIQG